MWKILYNHQTVKAITQIEESLRQRPAHAGLDGYGHFRFPGLNTLNIFSSSIMNRQKARVFYSLVYFLRLRQGAYPRVDQLKSDLFKQDTALIPKIKISQRALPRMNTLAYFVSKERKFVKFNTMCHCYKTFFFVAIELTK